VALLTTSTAEWCEMVMQFFQEGSVGIYVNEDIGPYVKIKRGDAEDPLSLRILNIVADMLAILIARKMRMFKFE
jgi:hypothetical protein